MESFQHNQVKLAVAQAVQSYAARRRLGIYFIDGMQLQLPGSQRWFVPDGFFVSYRTLREACRFRRSVRRSPSGLIGRPSLIVEIMSPSHLDNDKRKLGHYEKHGVKEFWLFRPAGASFEFDLLTLDRSGRYYRQRPFGRGGYSRVLKARCCLLALPTPVPGLPTYELSIQEESRVRKQESGIGAQESAAATP